MARTSQVEPSHRRERIVERWAKRRLREIHHERRVAAIATTLFDLTQHLHHLGGSERRLLRLSCLLHDVGRSIDRKSHPSEGARMIAADKRLPLSAPERRALCYLTRHHRGAVPQIGYDEWLSSSDDPKAIRKILAILRTADALDSRSAIIPRIVIALKGRKVAVTCYLEDDCPRARRLYQRRKRHRLIDELLGIRIEVEVRLAETVKAVA